MSYVQRNNFFKIWDNPSEIGTFEIGILGFHPVTTWDFGIPGPPPYRALQMMTVTSPTDVYVPAVIRGTFADNLADGVDLYLGKCFSTAF